MPTRAAASATDPPAATNAAKDVNRSGGASLEWLAARWHSPRSVLAACCLADQGCIYSIVAYLIGTNVVALATPHGSVATILARTVGQRHSLETPARRYLRSAWPYAVAGSTAGILALALIAQ